MRAIRFCLKRIKYAISIIPIPFNNGSNFIRTWIDQLNYLIGTNSIRHQKLSFGYSTNRNWNSGVCNTSNIIDRNHFNSKRTWSCIGISFHWILYPINCSITTIPIPFYSWSSTSNSSIKKLYIIGNTTSLSNSKICFGCIINQYIIINFL